MRSMFYNYDNNIDKDLSQSSCTCMPMVSTKEGAPNLSFIYNIKGELLGVCAKHGMPITLYFHLEELHGWPLAEFVTGHNVEFKLYSLSGKEIFAKTFKARDYYNATSDDLLVEIDQSEANKLRQETYCMEVKLTNSTGFYTLFAPADGTLVIR